jgi:hypothetical protein
MSLQVALDPAIASRAKRGEFVKFLQTAINCARKIPLLRLCAEIHGTDKATNADSKRMYAAW